jgi:transcriptional regulator with PAS, ATPase and Fis domain
MHPKFSVAPVAAHSAVPSRASEASPPDQPSDVEELDGGGFFVLASAPMRKIRAQIDMVARINIPVLILGESGSGKEVVARLLHKFSPRSHRPFLKVNCAAVPGELLESELFGYERGAFTGAVRSKPGTFETCNHGTLLLDEIAEMPPPLQAKLLHVLQDQEFTRLGSCSKTRVDVRVLAATNVNVREAIASNLFREDLFYRIGAFVFSIPPLRDRKEDIPILLRRYLLHYAGRLSLPVRSVSKQLMESCLDHNWPGNVRELENFAKRYLISGDASVTADFFDGLGSSNGVFNTQKGDLKSHVRQLRNNAEYLLIARALDETNWNRKEAAQLLNISYKSVLTKIKQFGLCRVSKKSLGEYVSSEAPSSRDHGEKAS